MLVHASCVLWKNKGIIFLGNSGSGKTTASMRLIEKGGTLVADDYIEISENMVATCPDNIFGKIEIRGVGIVSIPAVKNAKIDLAIQCTPDFKEVERIPTPQKWSIGNNSVPLFNLCPFDTLFCTKVDLLIKKT